ncbi:DUF4142 domain-containing protein [Sorangium cellulosum]|uniref:DUF4142 domain-containing protein n=1 Tax=Sorangium cellulosum TaxID=56 RepID=A0A150QZV7_SORCE|nr:DUF4142 domain-containing protein [Sorangium cellulosum]KYF73539.1 hypothetical protein BE15_15860 [Sorangium cellulosum]
MSIRINSLRFVWMTALALAGASACSVAAEDGDLAAADEGTSGEEVQSTSQAFTLSMPELAAVLGAFDANEIVIAQLALSHATDPHVLEFAQELLDYHALSNQRLLAALGQTGVRPLDNQISLALAEQGASDQLTLDGLTGSHFDWTFVDIQIYRHREFLAHLQEQISVVGPELQPGISHLVPEIRNATSRHLAFATSLPSLIGSPYVRDYGTLPGASYYGYNTPYYGPVYSGASGLYSPARPSYPWYHGRSGSFGSGAQDPNAPFGGRRP